MDFWKFVTLIILVNITMVQILVKKNVIVILIRKNAFKNTIVFTIELLSSVQIKNFSMEIVKFLMKIRISVIDYVLITNQILSYVLLRMSNVVSLIMIKRTVLVHFITKKQENAQIIILETAVNIMRMKRCV